MARGRCCEVGQRSRILLGALDAPRLQGIQSHDPRRDGGAETFREEWPEGLVFPPLDIPGRPIIDENEPKNVILGFGNGNRCALLTALAKEESHFKFEV